MYIVFYIYNLVFNFILINSCIYHHIAVYRLINISNNSQIKQVVDNYFPRLLGAWRVRRSVITCVKKLVKVHGIGNCVRMEYVCVSYLPTYLGCLFLNGTKRLAATKKLNVETFALQKESYGTNPDPKNNFKNNFEEVNLFSFPICAYIFRTEVTL